MTVLHAAFGSGLASGKRRGRAKRGNTAGSDVTAAFLNLSRQEMIHVLLGSWRRRGIVTISSISKSMRMDRVEMEKLISVSSGVWKWRNEFILIIFIVWVPVVSLSLEMLIPPPPSGKDTTHTHTMLPVSSVSRRGGGVDC